MNQRTRRVEQRYRRNVACIEQTDVDVDRACVLINGALAVISRDLTTHVYNTV